MRKAAVLANSMIVQFENLLMQYKEQMNIPVSIYRMLEAREGGRTTNRRQS